MTFEERRMMIDKLFDLADEFGEEAKKARAKGDYSSSFYALGKEYACYSVMNVIRDVYEKGGKE